MPAKIGNEAFRQPSDINSTVWKYLSFDSFMHLISFRKIPLIRIDQFEDKFEGKVDKENFKDGKIKTILDNIDISKRESRADLLYVNRLFNFASCWCIEENESAAMWKIFGKSKNCVAITSTYKILKDNLPNNLMIGMINYVTDMYKEYTEKQLDNMHTYIMSKRKSYNYEKEIRIIDYDTDRYLEFLKTKDDIGYIKTIPKVKYAYFDIENIVDKIFISPAASVWYIDLIKDVCKRYNVNVEIWNSSLDIRNINLI